MILYLSGWVLGKKQPLTEEQIEKIRTAGKNRVKYIWIRKIDKSEHALVKASEKIPDGWERGSIIKFNEKSAEAVRRKSKERGKETFKWLLPIYNEYIAKAVYGKKGKIFKELKAKYNIKGSWQNFLGKCRKYISNC